MKPKRTLGPAAFEAYMNFADSLKNGSNNDSIDRFKYRFAVKEGYIRPKKAITESAGGLSLGDFETAFKGLMSAFLPHMDQEEQEILSTVCANLDEKINGGDMAGAQDVIKGAMRDAGGDPDEYEDDDDDVPCDDDDDTCPPGETCDDGECVPEDDDDAADDETADDKKKKDLTEATHKPLNDYGNNKFHPEDHCPHINTKAWADPSKTLAEDYDDTEDDMYLPPLLTDKNVMFNDDEGNPAELDFEHKDFFGPTGDPYSEDDLPPFECQQKAGKKANSGKPNVEVINSMTPGFNNDDSDVALERDNYDAIDNVINRNHDMEVYNNRMTPSKQAMFSDDTEDFGPADDIDYDALADMILSDNGYNNMTVANGGVGPRNRQFMNRG
jgi:hypothetical protein